MKELDILVLVDRNSSVARAYLSYLRNNGYIAKKILILDFAQKSKTINFATRVFGKQLTTMLLRSYRYCKTLIKSRPQWLNLAEKLNDEFEAPFKIIGNFNFKDYAVTTRTLAVSGFDDPDLIEVVKHSKIKTLLYTGGGFVKPKLLMLPDIKIIHIHPGIVPDVKGADGIFWSAAIRKKLGYSAFFMKPGIDTGDILARYEYDIPNFSNKKYINSSSDDLYHAILLSYDAHMRAITLMKLIGLAEQKKTPLRDLSVTHQNVEEGRTYFFMHPIIRENVVKSLFFQRKTEEV